MTKKKDKDRTPVAQILVTQCTRCKLPLTHMVVLHNSEGIVERVQCRTCGSEHKYYPEKTEKKKATRKPAAKPRAGAKSRKPDAAKVFEKLSEKFQDKDPVPYSMQGSYKTDDVIQHKTFGKGYVTDASYHKIEVAFADASRMLVSDR